ncbi:hypothetical protein NHQ30_007257 [Ciborinia camelliae]|nr:hypothetical protein NHQ30_007257 [Ciborinia camelliae]
MTNSYPSGSPGVPDSAMPTGAPGFTPRRSSYASVLSGIGLGNSQQFGQSSRPGAFGNVLNSNTHMLNQQHDPIFYDPDYNYAAGRYGYGGFIGFDEENTGSNGGVNHGRPRSWSRQLPSFSSAFGSLANGHAHGGLGGHADYFFVPSYLKRSKYVQKLEEAHKTKVLAHRDGSAPSSQPNSLSTSASSINLHAKMVPSHRGRPYDLIEKSSLVEDESLLPLPSKWSTNDKFGALEVTSDALEVKLTGPKSAMNDRDFESCAIRSDHPMPPQCGIYYFEVTILSRKREDSIGIGFSSKQVPLSRLPGWEPDSWAYHGDDGHAYGGANSGKSYGPAFTTDDIIGCGINFSTGSAFFTKNGHHLGTAFRDINGKRDLFPSVGMKKPGEHIRVNFGQSPFVFDIDGMILVSETISPFPCLTLSTPKEGHTIKLAPPLCETELIQSLVLQFLTHDGYVETARAFADEVHSEKKALNMDPDVVIPGFDIKEDEDAGHRQRIRTAILAGDVEQALKHTNAYYPQVLKDNEHVYFRLRCRKFIEMVRQMAELHNKSNLTNGSKKNTAPNGDWFDDVISHDMELDDHQSPANNWDRMETDGGVDSETEYQNLLSETLSYGQILQAEFKDDPRREVSKALEDAFSLIAYKDPFNEKTVSHLLDPSGRVTVAEELNSAILLWFLTKKTVSLGKSSSAALEQLYQQTTVLLEDLREGGGPGAFVNIDDYSRPKKHESGSGTRG